MLATFSEFSPSTVIAVLALFWLNLLVVSFRLSRVHAQAGLHLPPRVVLNASVSGHLAGLFMMSLFGQVLGRHLVLRRFGVPSVLVATLTAYERMVVFVVSAAIGFLGFWYLLHGRLALSAITSFPIGVAVFTVVAALLLSVWWAKSPFEYTLFKTFFSFGQIRKFVEIAAVSVSGQALVLFATVLGVSVLQPETPLWELVAAAAATSFVAALPISVNGWGIREVAAVYTFGLLGVPSDEALAVSVLVGLCSTIVILLSAPFVIRKHAPQSPSGLPNTQAEQRKVAKTAAWLLSLAAAILVFFQVHVELKGGVVNVNLADPFALLAIAALVVHSLSERSLPAWRTREFNWALAAISVLLIGAFVNGAFEIGVTQWALGSRLTGWLVLLGYVSVGYFIVDHFGQHGYRRLAETLLTTAICVVIAHISLRILHAAGFFSDIQITQNFEGFAGNRNAFAFQLLVCSALLIAYWRVYSAPRVDVWRSRWVLIGHGVLIAGVVYSGSRAGLIVYGVMLAFGGTFRIVERRFLVSSLFNGLIIWALPLLIQVIQGFLGIGGAELQSSLSTAASNQERWETITRGLSMWSDDPLIGAGLGIFIEHSTQWFNRPLVIHSTPVWILAELGLVGLIVLAVAAINVFRLPFRGRFRSPPYRVLALIMVIFAVFGLVHEIFYQRIFWLVLGASMAVYIGSGANRNKDIGHAAES